MVLPGSTIALGFDVIAAWAAACPYFGLEFSPFSAQRRWTWGGYWHLAWILSILTAETHQHDSFTHPLSKPPARTHISSQMLKIGPDVAPFSAVGEFEMVFGTWHGSWLYWLLKLLSIIPSHINTVHWMCSPTCQDPYFIPKNQQQPGHGTIFSSVKGFIAFVISWRVRLDQK
jgi:hypothetical protein